MKGMKTASVPPELQGKASFAVRVKGDSLEPIYHDGDLLLVEATQTPRHGDLGVFYPRGQGRGTWWLRRYKEKDGQRRLLSLNPDIDPVPMTKDIVFKGRVLGSVSKESQGMYDRLPLRQRAAKIEER